MANNITNFPSRRKQGSTSTADQRHERLMAWVDAVLTDHIAAIQAARTMEELARVSFDAGSPEILRACHDALNPPDGHVEDHFEGRTEAQLKRFLLGRFKGLKRDREKELLRGPGAGQSSGPGGAPYYDWTADLIHNKQGKIIGNVANLILMMRIIRIGWVCWPTANSPEPLSSGKRHHGARWNPMRFGQNGPPHKLRLGSAATVWTTRRRTRCSMR